MTNIEAGPFPVGRGSVSKKWKSLKRTISYYLWLICILVMAVAVLIANNYLIYNSLTEENLKNKSVVDQAKKVVGETSDLRLENMELKSENENLKQQLEKLKSENVEYTEKISMLKKKNADMTSQVEELTKDNISLQNSLKIAASVGIKPKNYEMFAGISASRSSIERGTYIGRFKGTVYTPSKEECGNDKGITYSGKPIIPGISLAVDVKYWPLGTVFYIRGLGYAVAMDVGSAIKGKYRFDFAVFDKKFAYALGTRMWDVYLIKMGNGKVEEITF